MKLSEQRFYVQGYCEAMGWVYVDGDLNNCLTPPTKQYGIQEAVEVMKCVTSERIMEGSPFPFVRLFSVGSPEMEPTPAPVKVEPTPAPRNPVGVEVEHVTMVTHWLESWYEYVTEYPEQYRASVPGLVAKLEKYTELFRGFLPPTPR